MSNWTNALGIFCHHRSVTSTSYSAFAKNAPLVVRLRAGCSTFTDCVTGATFKVSRTQLPIMPEAARPLHSLQGATCDPGLIAHFTMPRRADANIQWLIVLVLVLALVVLLALVLVLVLVALVVLVVSDSEHY
jgi:hypothetical protein